MSFFFSSSAKATGVAVFKIKLTHEVKQQQQLLCSHSNKTQDVLVLDMHLQPKHNADVFEVHRLFKSDDNLP